MTEIQAVSAAHVTENLKRATEYLSRFGWVQGVYYTNSPTAVERANLGNVVDPNPPACVVGAIYATAANKAIGIATVNAVTEYLGVLNLPGWNDWMDRTRDDVVTALQETADSVKVARWSEMAAAA